MSEIVLPRPVDAPISSPFGLRVIMGESKFHKGIDFACRVGTPIKAVIEGVVMRAGWENEADPKQGFGLRVMQRCTIDGKDYFLFYAHLNELKVEEATRLKRGDVVGLSGNTGRTTGPHLHFGARICNTNEFCDVKWEGLA